MQGGRMSLIDNEAEEGSSDEDDEEEDDDGE